jgi:hypothetical protein
MIKFIYLIFVFFAGASNAVMDKLQFHFHKSIFSNKFFDEHFWNPIISWKNKYKERGDTWIVNLIEKMDNNGLVFLTDGWHLFQFIMLTFFTLAIIGYSELGHYDWFEYAWLNMIVDFLLIRFTFSGGFSVFFNKILEKREKKS